MICNDLEKEAVINGTTSQIVKECNAKLNEYT